MKAIALNQLENVPTGNIIQLPRCTPPAPAAKSRFRILPYQNRTGSQSWRVSGIRRTGERIRENFENEQTARCRQVELETEYLSGKTEIGIRATGLTAAQCKLAEIGFVRLGNDDDLLPAIDNWIKQGKQQSVAESPRLDAALASFLDWLKKNVKLRKRTKDNLRCRVSVFVNSTKNQRISEITPDTIDRFLDHRNTSPESKDNDRRAISRFFRWCIERPNRWASMNPCREVKVEKPERPPPAILSVEQCEQLLRAAEAHKTGRLVPYVALCLFGGLRPEEAGRIDWSQINLDDAEIRIKAQQSKTKKGRTVTIDATLSTWLKAYRNQEIHPANWRKDFDAVKEAAGFAWIPDVMRHTSISHRFRQTGSYGLTAEWAGNSEAVIKQHYQGRVSSADTKAFYAIMPTMKGAQS